MTIPSALPPEIKKELLLARAAVERAEFAQIKGNSAQKSSWLLSLVGHFWGYGKNHITPTGGTGIMWLELLSLLKRRSEPEENKECEGRGKRRGLSRLLKVLGVVGILAYLQLR